MEAVDKKGNLAYLSYGMVLVYIWFDLNFIYFYINFVYSKSGYNEPIQGVIPPHLRIIKGNLGDQHYEQQCWFLITLYLVDIH